MRTIQDYRDIYREIADGLDIKGDSIELLIQLLANASYMDEVENINYALEGSLERCSLINSKIQHCEDNMYSVFRGRCPRVLLKFRPTKYFTFNPFDSIISSNNFSVYYLGYYDPNYSEGSNTSESTDILPIESGFVYGTCTIKPAISDETKTIIGLIAPDTVEKKWLTTAKNTYYVNCYESDLSNDMFVYMGEDDDPQYLSVTRTFSEHILQHKVFDLTTTDFGSRLYIADVLKNISDSDIYDEKGANITLNAKYFRYSHLDSYNVNELKKMNISGAQMKAFDKEFLKNEYTELAPGIVLLSEVSRDNINTIHYRANKDRFISTILRTNSDVGTILEESYPEKIMSGGTNFIFGPPGTNESSVTLYYVPNNLSDLLTSEEKADFVNNKRAYYITDIINIEAGSLYTAVLNIDLELYQPKDVEPEIKSILKTFENKFNIDLENSKDSIRTLISKISNVKQVRGLDISYLDETGEVVNDESILYIDKIIDPETRKIEPNIYFKIEYNINSIIQSKS